MPKGLSLQIVADDILFFFFFFFNYFSEKIRLCISFELSARQTIHMKFQTLFSLKKKTTNKNQNASVKVVISTLRVQFDELCMSSLKCP